MAAPSGTVWGPIAGEYGRIGIYKSLSNNDTTTSVTVSIWFWSKYSVSDSNYTIYYDNLASSGSATSAQSTVDNVAINTTVASGDGWSTSNQVKLRSFTYSYTRSTSNVTRYLYAKLTNVDRVGAAMTAMTTFAIPKLASYTISYDANGGSGAPSSQTKYYEKSLTLSSTKPTRDGHTFQGWGTSKTATTESYAAGAIYTANATVTLYAVWKANTYTVKYDANGGTGAPSSQTKTYGVPLTLSSTKPTRDNYTFKGWSTSKTATAASYDPGDSYSNNSGATLYAVWELSYVKPRITEFSLCRCDSSGTETDEGTYARLDFKWACDKAMSSIKVEWESALNKGSATHSTSGGTSGTISGWIIGGGKLSTESTYIIRLIVTDASGYMYAFGTLSGVNFVIDFRAGGTGAAFGKPAELDGVLDIAYQTRFFGGILPPVLDAETDLNDVRVPNTYTGDNLTTYNYLNCPVTSGTFTLLVESCGEEGQVRQKYSSCSKYKPETYIRFYYQGVWGDWFWASTDEVLLYENTSGSNGTISLTLNGTGSATAASHYRYLEIYFTDNNGKSGGYTKIWNPSGKTVCLQLQEASSSIYYRQTNYTISGSTITPDVTNASYVRIQSGGGVTTSLGTNYIKIVRVIGRA